MKANNTLDIATTPLATLVEEHPSIAEDLLKHSFLPAFLLYPILYSALRFRKRNVTHKKFLYPDRKLLSSMTNTDAQQITKDIAQWEFLKIYTTYLQFGLFKTYGILPISKLSVATKGLSTAESTSKRYEDTTVLIRDYLSS